MEASVRLAAATAAASDQLGYSKQLADEWKTPPATDQRQSFDPREDSRGSLTLQQKRRLTVILSDLAGRRDNARRLVK